MCRAGVSVRRVENITGALWGRRANLGAITGLNQNISERVEEWRKRPLDAGYPCVSVAASACALPCPTARAQNCSYVCADATQRT